VWLKWKTKNAKSAGGVTQVVACLSSKDEALSSIPNTTKKKKKKRKRELQIYSMYLIVTEYPIAWNLLKFTFQSLIKEQLYCFQNFSVTNNTAIYLDEMPNNM
jgi:hypothetical protein